MIHRIDQVERWLYELGLARLQTQEALYLAQPTHYAQVCQVFDDLVQICRGRCMHGALWPDFAVLGVPCALPSAPWQPMRARIFAIGVPCAQQRCAHSQDAP